MVMGIFQVTGDCFAPLATTLPLLIIWSFLRNDNIVRVTFDETGIGDAREAGFGAQVFKRRRARIAHARTQTADELIHIFAEHALVRHATFDALRDKLAASALT